jgi:hypothetical protein
VVFNHGNLGGGEAGASVREQYKKIGKRQAARYWPDNGCRPVCNLQTAKSKLVI